MIYLLLRALWGCADCVLPEGDPPPRRQRARRRDRARVIEGDLEVGADDAEALRDAIGLAHIGGSVTIEDNGS